MKLTGLDKLTMSSRTHFLVSLTKALYTVQHTTSPHIGISICQFAYIFTFNTIILLSTKGRVPRKKTTKVRTYVQTVGRQGIFEPYFCQKKVWTKIFRVGRSDFDVHTYKSMQNLEYGDGRDLFPMVWKGFLYILSHS